MSKIVKLDQKITNLIAAGEVIERVQSVVKELVENSIDAKSTIINVDLIDSGFKEIRVTDNGTGMEEDDIKCSVLPHYTSKISLESDLFSIHTLGFRGEALPSIAAVSDLTIVSSIGKDGVKCDFKDGNLISCAKTARDRGTTITVRNLFYNTPARLQNMSNQYSEISYVSEYLTKMSFAYPNVSFKLTNNDKVLFQTLGTDNLLEAISNVYGVGVAKEMIPFEASNNYFNISGYTSKLSVLRSTKSHITLLINGRIIRNYPISNAIINSYSGRIMIGKYPIIILNINCDYSLVDVNVHPAKAEVRFSNEKSLCSLINETLINVLSNTDLTVKAELDYRDFDFKVSESKTPDPFDLFDDSVKSSVAVDAKDVLDNETINSFECDKNNVEYKKVELDLRDDAKFSLNYIGQLFETYLLCENGDEFYLIDQHAAEERVNYERIKKLISEKDIMKEELLVPFNFTFPINEYSLIIEKKDVLDSLGIEIEEFGKETLVVRKIGTWIVKRFAYDYLEEVFTAIIKGSKSKKEEFLDSLSKSIACKASIKANEYHNADEFRVLIDLLSKCDNPYTCPHGRPTIVKYTKFDIEKLFRRIV